MERPPAMSTFDHSAMNMKYSGARATPREFLIGFTVAAIVLGIMFGFVQLSPVIFGAP